MSQPARRKEVADQETYNDVWEILGADHGLSEWEINFATDLSRNLEAGGKASSAQKAKIKQILDKIDSIGDDDEEPDWDDR
jgi:hypothetical protein